MRRRDQLAGAAVTAPAFSCPVMKGERVDMWRQPLVVAVLLDQFEQFDDTARGELRAFVFVEPDALAGEANIKRQRGEITPRQNQPRHRQMA